MKHWRLALVALVCAALYGAAVWAPSYSPMQVGAARAQGNVIGGGVYGDIKLAGGGCSAYNTWIARTSGTSTTEKTAYQTTICAMVTDGTWALTDFFYWYATNTATTALLNLPSATYSATVTGGMTFTADHGYTGDGSTGSVDLGFNASTAISPHFAATSAAILIYNLTSRGSQVVCDMMNGSPSGVSGESYIFPQTSGTVVTTINDSLPAISATSVNAQGQWLATLSGTSDIVYKNGSSVGTGTATSSALGALDFISHACLFGSLGMPSNWSTDQLSIVWGGAGLNSTQAPNLMSDINAGMTVLGINAY